MNKQLRVGIVSRRFEYLGGIQTCIIELVTGLNELGIEPEIVWDEPMDWNALQNPDLRASFGGGRFPVSSERLRSLSPRVARAADAINLRFARLNLDRYDFVYCFVPGVRLPAGVPNVCWLTGPWHLRLPGDRVNWERWYDPRELRLAVNHLLWPLKKADKYSNYVTHSDWIADLFRDRYGFRPPVIWPPARSRVLPTPPAEGRSGILWLSRLVPEKRVASMLAVAKALPNQKITLAGAVADESYLASLKEQIGSEGLNGIRIVENPREAEVASLLTSHDVFVFTAAWEHFGIVTVEAIQAGLLPIVHNTGGQKEIVPVESLRFLSDDELIDRVRSVVDMPQSERVKTIGDLQLHAERGFPKSYQEAMLSYLKPLLSA